ncbi:hypothetical protein [Hydrogenophaga flava]|uniref:hypothetical protein n=1 Tax=Hydrogenophaga flava TaxID=65657 RepID=UPI0008268525|nr:hypothetical protein [Hydrogenophaga flava]
MDSLWRSAWLVDAAIAITLAEWLGLVVYHRLTGRGLAPRSFQWNLVSGLCLMAALRCALLDLAWTWGAGCLAASGAAHLAYLRQRWRRQRESRQAFLV